MGADGDQARDRTACRHPFGCARILRTCPAGAVDQGQRRRIRLQHPCRLYNTRYHGTSPYHQHISRCHHCGTGNIQAGIPGTWRHTLAHDQECDPAGCKVRDRSSSNTWHGKFHRRDHGSIDGRRKFPDPA